MNKGYIQLINHRRKSGIALYKSGNVILKGNQFYVKSATDPNTEYNVTLEGCECSDFQKRISKNPKTFPCKHMNGLMLQLGLESEDTFILEQEVV